MKNNKTIWEYVVEYIKANWLHWLTLGLTALVKYLTNKNEKK